MHTLSHNRSQSRSPSKGRGKPDKLSQSGFKQNDDLVHLNIDGSAKSKVKPKSLVKMKPVRQLKRLAN